MREPPASGGPVQGRSLWVPLCCQVCERPKRTAEGALIYHDLLAGPEWARIRGRYVPLRPSPYVCEECHAAKAALRALGRDDDDQYEVSP